MPPKLRAHPPSHARLRLLVCSDLRVQAIPELITWVGQLKPRPDLILYAGDDIHRFRPDSATNYWVELASMTRYGVAAVLGNDDDPDLLELYPIEGHRCVHHLGTSTLRIGNFAFHGVDGAEETPENPGIGWCRSPGVIRALLERAIGKASGATHVLVSHSPPQGVLDGARRFSADGRPRCIGSLAVRRTVLRHSAIKLVCCGHVHLQGGRHEWLGKALVVNAASHDDVGAKARVALIALTHEGVQDIVWHELKLAAGFDCMPEFGSTRAALMRAHGIPHVAALAKSTPRQVVRALGWSRPAAALPFLAQAHAVTHQVPVVFAPLLLAPAPRLLLDIETDLDNRQIWMVALLDQGTGEFIQLVAPREKDEAAMLKALACEIRDRARPLLTWSGSHFDARILGNGYRRWRLPLPPALFAAEDGMIQFKLSIALPLPDWKLGTIADWCGFTYRVPDLTGMQVGALCEEYRRRGRRPPRDVLYYNEDDVRALEVAMRRLETLMAGGLTTPEAWRDLPGTRRRRNASRPRLEPRAVAKPSRVLDLNRVRVSIRRVKA
jgi:Icc-related predicted phosphoesterase